jgi:tripartite-type tricarboxylate transporter receptor subunit TctC
VQAVNDLLAGQIQMMFSDMVPAIPQIKGGKLRPLAVAAPKRLEILPDIPTMTELGLPGFENATWWAMIAPKGTPPLVVTRINSELGKAMTLPDVLEVYTRLGMTTQHSSPAKVFEQVRVQSAAMGKLLKSVGVQPE